MFGGFAECAASFELVVDRALVLFLQVGIQYDDFGSCLHSKTIGQVLIDVLEDGKGDIAILSVDCHRPDVDARVGINAQDANAFFPEALINVRKSRNVALRYRTLGVEKGANNRLSIGCLELIQPMKA